MKGDDHEGMEQVSVAEHERTWDGDRPSTPRITLKRKFKERAKRGLRGLFELGQRFGVDILPRHFYSEVPDLRALRRDESWKRPHDMVGVHGTETDAQFAFIERCCSPEVVARLRDSTLYRDACEANGEPGFSRIDAEALYAFVSEIRPPRIVQVGCGVSTAVILRAAADASDYRPEIVCVEPYPTDFLKNAAREGLIQLVEQPAQSVPLEILTNLGENGFLFIDSTHTIKPGSEVNRLVLEVLPRLRPQAWVHFHDIYFPYDYQRGLLDDELFFCNETALVHAFLINNHSCRIRASLSMLHYAGPPRLQRSFPSYQPAANDHGLRASSGDFPASIYLEVVRTT